MANQVPYKIRSIWPPLVLLAMSSGYTLWAQSYGATPRMMPTIVGGTTAVLCLLDVVSRLSGRMGQAVRTSLGADFADREMSHDPPLAQEMAILAWMVGVLVGVIVVGLIPAILVFVATFMRFWGRLPWRGSIVSGGLVMLFVTLVFEVLLSYDLYRGMLEPVWPW